MNNEEWEKTEKYLSESITVKVGNDRTVDGTNLDLLFHFWFCRMFHDTNERLGNNNKPLFPMRPT